MARDVDNPQWRNQQRNDRKQSDFEKQRQRNRQSQLHQAFKHVQVRSAEAFIATDIAHRTGATYPGDHAEEHHPVNGCRRHAAADAAQLRHAKVAVDKDIVNGNIDQQADKSHHHPRFGFRQAFALVTSDLEEEVAGGAPQQRAQVAYRFFSEGRVDIVHRADDVPGVPQHDHNQQRNESRQPEPLTNLMGNAVAAAGAV